MGEEELNRGRGATGAAAPQSPLIKPLFSRSEAAAAAVPPQSATAGSLPAGGRTASAAEPSAGGKMQGEGESSGRLMTGTRLSQQLHPSRAGRSPHPRSSAAGDTYHVRRRHESSATAGGEQRAAEDFKENKEDLGFSSASAEKKETSGKACCPCGCPRQTVSDFMQQRLPAWQPVLSPRRILTALGVCGLVFLGLGILILVCSNQILECKVDYTHETASEVMLRIGPEHCTDTNAKEIKGDVYLFYELHNFYQNHRRYLKSRSDAQLQGKVYTSPGEVKAVCDPRYLSEDGRVLDPCGLNAVAVFTDAYSVWKEGPTGNLLPIDLDETRETICWHFDLRSRFKNPSPAEREEYAGKVDFWLFQPAMQKALHMDKPGVGEGVENSHFIVWMREAALPEFRKIYGKIQESPLQLPFFVRVSGNDYDVESFGGRKYVVVSQSSWLGGRNSFLGITYIVVACVCILVFLLLGYAQMRNPRHMGDVSWLRKALYADG